MAETNFTMLWSSWFNTVCFMADVATWWKFVLQQTQTPIPVMGGQTCDPLEAVPFGFAIW